MGRAEKCCKFQKQKADSSTTVESIPWESFPPLFDKGYAQERRSNASRRRIDPLILFRMLVLQQLFNLGDDETKFQENDCHSFEELFGLGIINDIPDTTTPAFSERSSVKPE